MCGCITLDQEEEAGEGGAGACADGAAAVGAPACSPRHPLPPWLSVLIHLDQVAHAARALSRLVPALLGWGGDGDAGEVGRSGARRRGVQLGTGLPELSSLSPLSGGMSPFMFLRAIVGYFRRGDHGGVTMTRGTRVCYRRAIP